MFTARRVSRGSAILDRNRTASESIEARLSFLYVTRVAVAGSGKALSGPGAYRARCPIVNHIDVEQGFVMKPTVYLPLADLCPTGVRRASASTIGRFNAGRVSTHRLWIETEGTQASQYQQ